MPSRKALKEFLDEHCEVKLAPSGAGKERCYILRTDDCILFMAETHVQEMRGAGLPLPFAVKPTVAVAPGASEPS